MRRLLFSAIILSFFIPFYSHAQLPTAADIPGETFTLSASINLPAPGQKVTVTLSSVSTDLDRSSIEWIVDGKSVASGLGKKSQSVTVGAVGQNTSVRVLIVTPKGDKFTKELSIQPQAAIDMLWEAKAYTPPFYEGKALPSYQGEIVIEALPNLYVGGKRVDPKTLVYAWQSDRDALGAASGYGKNTIRIQSKGINVQPLTVSVRASSVDGALSGQGSVLIPMQSPVGLFYENNPVYGILYNRALAPVFNLDKKEMTLNIAPYNFSVTTPHNASTVDAKWSLNSSKTASQNSYGNELVLRIPDATSGSSQITVRMTTPKKLLQYSSSNMLINFSSQ